MSRLLHIWGTTVVPGIVLLMAPGDACTGDPATPSEPDEALPGWLERVYPPPGAEAAPIAEIEVEHNVTAQNEQIRLLIDGTDVTTYSDLDTGELVYDVENDRVPVEIDVGRHHATVERRRVPEDFDVGVDEVEVLDTFEWEFTVQ